MRVCHFATRPCDAEKVNTQIRATSTAGHGAGRAAARSPGRALNYPGPDRWRELGQGRAPGLTSRAPAFVGARLHRRAARAVGQHRNQRRRLFTAPPALAGAGLPSHPCGQSRGTGRTSWRSSAPGSCAALARVETAGAGDRLHRRHPQAALGRDAPLLRLPGRPQRRTAAVQRRRRTGRYRGRPDARGAHPTGDHRHRCGRDQVLRRHQVGRRRPGPRLRAERSPSRSTPSAPCCRVPHATVHITVDHQTAGKLDNELRSPATGSRTSSTAARCG